MDRVRTAMQAARVGWQRAVAVIAPPETEPPLVRFRRDLDREARLAAEWSARQEVARLRAELPALIDARIAAALDARGLAASDTPATR